MIILFEFLNLDNANVESKKSWEGEFVCTELGT